MRRFLALFSVAFGFALASLAQQTNKIIECEQYAIPTNTTTGSGYTAIECGLDGKIYVGTAHYGESAHLVRFDLRTKRWDDLIDAHQVTRWNGAGLDSQSKFHAKIQVDADGVVWAATKQGNEDFVNRPEFGENPTGYPGGHLFSYNPKTGEVIDHGILRKQEGLMSGAVDRKRRVLYYWSDPKQHLLQYDIAKNTVRDLGAMGGYPRYIAIDHDGRVFGMGRKGIFWMFDPVADELYDLAAKLEGPGKFVDPYAIALSADGKKIFGCAITGEHVMEFDLNTIKLGNTPLANGANGTITCRHVARSIPEPLPFGDQHAATLGKDGCFYFPNVSKSDNAHLIRYDPRRNQIADLGIMKVKGKPDNKLTSAQGACVTPDGTLWMMFIDKPYSIIVFPKLSAANR